MSLYEQAKLEEIFYQADLDIKDGHYETAIRRLEEILVEDPNFGKAYNHLGWLFETKFKNMAKAEEYYKKCFEKTPDYPAIYSNYSVLLSTLGKFQELELVLQQGLSVPGVDKANLYNEYGIMHELKGNLEQAMHFYKECGKATLAKDTLDRAVASIERCKTKLLLG